MKEDIFVNDWNEVCFALSIKFIGFWLFHFAEKINNHLHSVEKSRKARCGSIFYLFLKLIQKQFYIFWKYTYIVCIKLILYLGKIILLYK